MDSKAIETSKRLRKALDDKCMKPIELANKTGINKGSISQYLSAAYSPSNINAEKMGNALNVSPLWLMGFDMIVVDEEKYDKRERLNYYFTLLKEEDQAKVVEYAEFLINKYEEGK